MPSWPIQLVTTVARSRHLVSAVATASGLLALSLPWVSTEAVAGQSVSAGWGDLSALSLSLAVAAVAAWGASSLSAGRPLRALGFIQGGLSGAGLLVLILSFSSPRPALASVAREVTGLDLGTSSLAGELTWNFLGPTLAIASLLGLIAGGVLAGVTRTTPTTNSGSRYERGTDDSADPWDQLSSGVDPTER